MFTIRRHPNVWIKMLHVAQAEWKISPTLIPRFLKQYGGGALAVVA
jgi:hypothetical protein